ncbi:MAG: hypothetical protein ACM3L8_04400 [Verrucomicrobiota bacterium]
MPSRRPDIRPVAALIAFLALFAAAGAAAAETVTVDVGAVYASNEGSSVDPALREIRGKLRAMFNYTSYRMLDRKRQTLAVGASGDFALPGQRSMRVSPLQSPPNKVRLLIRIEEAGKQLLTTTLGMPRGGMVLVGGPSYQSGVLILIIAAE